MSLTGWLDRFQQRHPAVSFPLAVVYKYTEDSGPYLAALIAYYGFLSLFPMLLLVSTLLSFALTGDPALQQRILGSALRQFPVVGDQLGDPKRLSGGAAGLVIGIVGSVYGGLGVAQAVQYAMNTAWRVPRNSRPNPFKARALSLLLLVAGGLAVIGTTVLSTLGSSGAGSLGPIVKGLVLIASTVLNAGVFLVVFRLATARRVSVREIAPGAIVAAVVWQLLQSFGVVYVSHVVKNASATNGVFALVLGLLAFLYVTAGAVLLCVELNVVRVERLYPRSLLTPFTDNVVLTRGDRRAYTSQATAERNKGFESIDVHFDPPSGREAASEEPDESSRTAN